MIDEDVEFQAYWSEIQTKVPTEMWGFLGFYLKHSYAWDAFKRKVSVDIIAQKVINEYNKAQSAMLN